MRTARLVVVTLALVACGKKSEEQAKERPADACAAQRTAVQRLLTDARDSLSLEAKARLDPLASNFPETPIGGLMKSEAVAAQDATQKRQAADAEAIKALDASLTAVKNNAGVGATISALSAALRATRASRAGYADAMQEQRRKISALNDVPSQTGAEHEALYEMFTSADASRYASDATEFADLETALAQDAVCRAGTQKQDAACAPLNQALETELAATKPLIAAAVATKAAARIPPEQAKTREGQQEWVQAHPKEAADAFRASQLPEALVALDKALVAHAAGCAKL